MNFLRKDLVHVSLQSIRSVKSMKFGVVVEKDQDGYYVASVPELPGCHTQAKTLDKVMERIKEAIEARVQGLKSAGRQELVGVQFVEVQA
jgi:predicted RNase H-like HicB family nuclease